ncbi:GreA/GreB family elongation factor [Streptomyces mangrovisoli]|uniref:Nucleoside diphosphate kinase regulator n=1 Tax=Streptomyces mangrovisoli TaxID=1428628 RepID=A0A1J4P1F0_9ACTN|nr:GreA/GreB family elongation factor [Streptomyces mangrovisoli]OIJ68427.1 nucleoside diphosphate kinase regulator [Streptomyces mangrovisoli]
MSSEPEPISDASRRALEEELATLRSERATVAATLGGDDIAGDSADAADELQRADDVERLDARITAITTRLQQAAQSGAPPTDVAGVGSTVTVRLADGAVENLHIAVMATEADQGVVTADSPLGHALLGHRAGDTVSYDAPDGKQSVVVVALG